MNQFNKILKVSCINLIFNEYEIKKNNRIEILPYAVIEASFQQ